MISPTVGHRGESCQTEFFDSLSYKQRCLNRLSKIAEGQQNKISEREGYWGNREFIHKSSNRFQQSS